jgi:hypothetical protein
MSFSWNTTWRRQWTNYILCRFQQLSGPLISFHKRQNFCVSQAKKIKDQYRQLTNKEWKAVDVRANCNRMGGDLSLLMLYSPVYQCLYCHSLRCLRRYIKDLIITHPDSPSKLMSIIGNTG